MTKGIESAPGKLPPEVAEARQVVTRAMTDLIVGTVKELPAALQTDHTFAEIHLAVIWQMANAMVGANIANIDAVRNACSMGIHDGIRSNAILREAAKKEAH